MLNSVSARMCGLVSIPFFFVAMTRATFDAVKFLLKHEFAEHSLFENRCTATLSQWTRLLRRTDWLCFVHTLSVIITKCVVLMLVKNERVIST